MALACTSLNSQKYICTSYNIFEYNTYSGTSLNVASLMPLLPGVFSIYSLDPKFMWLPRPKWLKQEMTQHIPGIGGVKSGTCLNGGNVIGYSH